MKYAQRIKLLHGTTLQIYAYFTYMTLQNITIHHSDLTEYSIANDWQSILHFMQVNNNLRIELGS